MTVIMVISLVPAVILAAVTTGKKSWFFVTALCPIIAAAVVLSGDEGFRKVSEYKPVSGALNLPGGGIINEAYSPLSVVQVAVAEGLRSTSGLSLVSPYDVPVQRVMFFDGDSPVAITRFSGELNELKYLKYLSSWLPYYLKRDSGGSVLIIGAGGGESLLKAWIAGFGRIDAVEINSAVISLMKNENAQFSGNIYSDKRVSLYNEDGRSFARRSLNRYDLIDLPMIDAFNSAASGVYALNESYLYTVESFSDFYSRLTSRGIFSVTRWITTPPRDSLKIFNTAVASLKKMKITDPGKHLIAIRSVQTLTILVSASPFTVEDINSVKKYCAERLFDVTYCPGMSGAEADRNIRQDKGLLYRSFAALLSSRSEEFIRGYDSDISAPEDNRPYFYNFFKPAFLKYIVRYGTGQVPVTEWGYLLLVIIFIPVAIISFICILYPLLRIREGGNEGKRWLVPYFALIAAGYFFIEMPLIQKMILFLGSPVFSMGIIISTLLVFSGLGSMFSGRLFRRGRGILKCTITLCLIILLYIFLLDYLFKCLISISLSVKILIIILLVSVPAFFMGMPFPRGLSLLKGRESPSLPFAWGVNGFFSVISIIAASICAVISGYRVVFAAALIFYIIAGVIFPWREYDGS